MPDAALDLSDLALAGAVGILALVPAALLLLAVAALLRALDVERRLSPGGFRLLLAVLGTGLGGGALLLAWTWGGATHLKPRCIARAEPVYASVLYPGGDAEEGTPVPVPVAVLQVVVDGNDPPRWASSLLGPGGWDFYEWRRPDGRLLRVGADGARVPASTSVAGALLRVNRSSGRSSAWATITVDRFRLTDLATGTLLADGEELWVDAGPARYRCGIAGGPWPVAGRDYPAGDGVARFILKAIRPLP